MGRALSRVALIPCLLAPGCAAKRVDPPPPPPALTDSSPSSASGRASGKAAKTDDNESRAPDPGAGATAQPESSPPTAADVAKKLQEAKDTPLGWVAGVPLEAEELLIEWGDVASRELMLVLDKLVATRLALAEASRLGIRLTPEAVDLRFASERGKLEGQLTRKGKERTLDEAIRNELGFEPDRYLERVRRATIRQMLAERAVRACSFESETVSLRLIVVPDEEQMKKVQDALAAGRDFAEVAREFSVDDSKTDGGLIPYVASEERSPLASLAFRTPIGEIAGPVPVADHQLLLKVEEHRDALQGDWTVLEKAVEESLAQNPVADAEFVHWKIAMEKRYPIDLGPLWSLIGAAR